MFGLFKKLSTIDTTASTDKCVSYLSTLPFETQQQVALKMLDCLKLYRDGKLGSGPAEFIKTMVEAKQSTMIRNRLRSHEHPEFAFLQLLEDSAISGWSKVANPGYSWNIAKAFILEYLPTKDAVFEQDTLDEIDWSH